MQPAKFLVELRRILPLNSSAAVVSALRNDPLTWNAIQEPAFLRVLLTHAGENLADWSIANLGLLAANIEQSTTELAAEPMIGLDSDLSKTALIFLEETLRTSRPPKNLADATIMGLALRERRRRTGSWKGLLNELSPKPGVTVPRTLNTWQTALSCLYSIVPDPADLLAALLPKQSLHPSAGWITQILFSNPMPFSTRIQALAEFMIKLPAAWQVEWLRMLSQTGKEDTARQLARMLLDADRQPYEIADDFNFTSAEWSALQERSARLQQAAAINQLAGNDGRARSYIKQAQRSASYWLAGLAIQSAALEEESLPDDCRQALSIAPGYSRIETDCALTALQAPVPGMLPEVLRSSKSPLARIIKAWQRYHEGEQAAAKDMARQALSDWMESFSPDLEPGQSQFVLEWSPVRLMDLFTEMDLYSEAAHLGEKFLAQRVDDLPLMVKLSQTYSLFGRLERAVNFAHEALLLDQENPERYRQVALLWEEIGDWSRAQAEWHTKLNLSDPPSTSDLLAFANASLRAGQPSEAETACQKVLAGEPEHAMAITYSGQALTAQGNYDRAVELLKQAALLAADDPRPWVALSATYEQAQEPEKALDTLQSAVAANPESAELQFSLGEFFLHNHLSSEALPYLRKAVLIAPESIPVTTSLVKTLLELGHSGEARALVEKARQRWEHNPALAYLHGRILIEQGDREAGLQALEVALRSEIQTIEPGLLYADELILNHREHLQKSGDTHDHTQLNQAMHVLQNLLAEFPENFEVKLRAAEGILLKGNASTAFERFSQLLEVTNPEAAPLRWKVEAGLGEAALRTGQLETALAAFQSALQSRPDSIETLHLLTEAYGNADLKEEARDTADRALQTAPGSIANLSWYAKVMNNMGRLPQAEEALKRAIDLDVDRSDLMIRLADIQIQSGNLEQARETLFGVAHMATATTAELRQAAYLFLDLKDEESALDCLTSALKDTQELQVPLLYEAACLYRQMGRIEEALDAIQKAIVKQPDGVHLYLAQADLLSSLGRSQSALNSLENVLRMQQNLAGFETARTAVASKLAPMVWKPNALDSIDVHIRFALLLKRVGNLPEAFEHAVKALGLCPDNLTLRFLAVDLAFAMLRFEQALELAAIPELSLETMDEQISVLGSGCAAEQIAAMYGLKAELALETGDPAQARVWVEKGMEFSAENLRLRAAQVRLYEHEGDVQAASRLCEGHSFELSAGNQYDLVQEECGPLGIAYQINLMQGTWAAEAALAGHQWQTALNHFQSLAATNPEEPRALLALTRSIVRLSETQRLCEDLECQAHAPGRGVENEEVKDLFRRSLQDLARLCKPDEIRRWKSRFDAALSADEETVQALKEIASADEDNAALLSAARRAKVALDTIAYKNMFPESTTVQAQVALNGLVENDIEEYFMAQQVVEKEPRNPLWHTLYARAAEASGEIRYALESMEIALELWPEEPRWHAQAARLAEMMGMMDDAVPHWEKALELSGEDLSLAYELGTAYLANGESTKAIQMLQVVCEKRPDWLEAWTSLSEAYLQGNLMEDALECARKATNLDGEDSRPLIQAGKVYLAMGAPAEALEMARQARQKSAQPEQAILLQSKSLAALEDDQAAIRVLEDALVDLPASEILQLERVRRIQALEGSGKVKPILSDLAIQFPNNAEVFSLLSKAQIETGDPDGAEQSAVASLRLDPDQSDLHLLLGFIDRKAGNLDQAVHHFTQAIQLAPDDVEGYLELGKAHEMRREQSEAVYAFQQAMAVAPEDHRPYYLAALALRDGKDYLNAEKLLRQAAELAPNDLNIRRQLGAVIALNLVHHSQEANSCL